MGPLTFTDPDAVFYQEDRLTLLRGDAANLALPDNSVDLIVTSPPYFGLRSYKDGGEHYAGQVGAEATPAEFVAALVACTREWVRVLKPSGSLWVNLGDKYAGGGGFAPDAPSNNGGSGMVSRKGRNVGTGGKAWGFPQKSLVGIPWRYAIACIDDLGLILRAEVVWAKPNGLPESVKDRVRRSHEQWFHFTLAPRYFSSVDEIRDAHASFAVFHGHAKVYGKGQRKDDGRRNVTNADQTLGKLPGSVWTIATQPLRVPDDLGIDHFAAFPMEWPRRIIKGWAPTRGICQTCGEGLRPTTDTQLGYNRKGDQSHRHRTHIGGGDVGTLGYERTVAITGYACDCDTPGPTTPAVVLDPFGGTGTTALVAWAHGCHGVSNDLSADYCRLAQWRTTDPKQRERAARPAGTKPAKKKKPAPAQQPLP